MLSPTFAFLFASPWAALLAGLGAISLPVIIHLLSRRRYRIIPWAAMRFLLAAQKQNIRKMRLEQLLLLIVRTTMMLLLVLAMVSVMPWAEALWYRLFPAGAALAAATGQRTHRILVIDASMSMALKRGDKTCFDLAKSRAGEILDLSSAGDGFSVLLLAAPPQRIVGEAADDPRRVADEIRTLRTTHGNADLSATLHAIEDTLRRSPAKFEAREVYFLTDLQRSTWLNPPERSPTGSRLNDVAETMLRIQQQARVVFVDVGQDGADNVAVTNLTLGNALATTGSNTPIVATLNRYGSDEPRQTTVEFLVGKARETAGDPAYSLRLIGQEVVTVPPGRAGLSLTFSYKFATPGTYVVQVRTVGDDLEPDDARSIVLAVKDAVPVMLVNGRPAGELYDQATEFLRDALNPFQEGIVPHNVPARPRIVSESTFGDAALGDLTPFDCVFLCDVARLGTPEVRRLEAHLRRGGGVVFCLGPQVDLEAYNRIIYRDGQGILPARLLGKQRAPEGRYFTLYADEESYKKPPLSAFVGDRDRAVLQAVSFQQFIRTELPTASSLSRDPAGERSTTGPARKVMTFMPDPQPGATKAEPMPVGEGAIIEWPRYRGRVILITTTVNSAWTSWPKLPSFPVLMQELLRFSVAGRLKEQTALVGEPLEEYLPVGSAGLSAGFRTPDNRTVMTQTQSRDDATLLRFSDTDQSGVYVATIGQHPQERLFAVNVPTATEEQQGSESDLSRTDLQGAYPGWSFQVVTDPRKVDRSVPKESDSERQPTSRGLGAAIARVLLWGMLLLMLVETVLAWKLGHHSKNAVPAEVPVAEGRAVPLGVAIAAGVAFVLIAGVLIHTALTDDFLGFLPDFVRGKVEAVMGVPQPVAGESTRRRLDYTPFLPVRAALAPWVMGALAMGAITLVVGIYFREGRTAPGPYRVLLAGLRIFLVLLALLVLLPQLQLWFERQGWPDIAILIDDSKSMSAVDPYQDPAVKEAAAKLAQVTNLPAPQRLQLAQALLARPDASLLEDLILKRKVKLHVYRCSSGLVRLADVTEPEEVAAGVEAIQELRPVGETSRLGSAVRQVLTEFRGASLAAIIMFTDGVTTDGEDLSTAARHASQAGVPLYFIGLGDAHEPRDLILHDLQVEDTVFVHDRLVFEAKLTAQGYPQLPAQPVILYEKTKEGQLKELARQMVTPDPTGKPVKFRLMHQPDQPGERLYVIEVPAQADEPQPPDNNRLERAVFVREAKAIRVLYIEGFPRSDFRYIKPLLEREQADAKGRKSVELQVLLLHADDEFPGQDRSARSEFPTKEELNQFDVVLLGDVDLKHAKLGDRNLKLLADFVKERGGGLLLLAGEHYGIRGYKGSPLADVLPIQQLDNAPAAAAERQWLQSFRPQLTPVGRLHPIFRFTPDEAENAAIWNRLPELYWYATGYKLQPAAEVLAVHPAEKSADPKKAGDERHPLIVQHFVGAGRCMFLGVEDTWRWAYREDILRFNQFWLQTIRYLARSGLGRIELRLDRQTAYRRGEPIHVMVRFPDDSPPPDPSIQVKVVLERSNLKEDPPESEVQTLSLAKLEGSRASYETMLTRTPVGEYRFWLSAPPVAGPKPRAECKVLRPPGEMEKLRMNQVEMERAAAETRGRFYTLASADRLIDDLPSGYRMVVSAPSPPWLLWNHLAAFGLVVGLLGAEWVLRKRKHLL